MRGVDEENTKIKTNIIPIYVHWKEYFLFDMCLYFSKCLNEERDFCEIKRGIIIGIFLCLISLMGLSILLIENINVSRNK